MELKGAGDLNLQRAYAVPLTHQEVNSPGPEQKEASPSVPTDESFITTGKKEAPPEKIVAREKKPTAPSGGTAQKEISRVPLFISSIQEEQESKASDPLLGPIPPSAVLPQDERKRLRALLNGMISSAPNPKARKTVIDQLEAFGISAASLVHNYGTRIVIIPANMKLDEALKKFGLSEDDARDLKRDTGGMYLPVQNTIYLREDMISDGSSARVSAFVNRHEFAHALEDALGYDSRTGELYLAAKKGNDANLITSYAGTNAGEYFAESTAAFLSPEGEFSGDRGFVKRFLAGTAEAFSGFEPRTSQDLLDRDAPAWKHLAETFENRIPAKKPYLHRRKDNDYEAWLWRAHQVDPGDGKIRIALLDRQKSRAPGEGARRIEQGIEEEYGKIEKSLIDRVKASPGDSKGIYSLLDHYLERAGRLNEGAQVSTLENRALKVVDFYLRNREKMLKKMPQDEQRRKTGDLIQECDYLAGQFNGRSMEKALEYVRDFQKELMTASLRKKP